MIIYRLYVKTHEVTGLKYLGFTTELNYHHYIGSGVYWRTHLKKYGRNFTTKIIKECTSREELKECGLFYSKLWNIVDERNEFGKKTWANLIPESGVGVIMTPEVIAKQLATKRKNGTMFSLTPEIIANIQLTKIKNGTNIPTKEQVAKGLETRRRNGGLKRTEKCISTMLETKRKNGNMNSNTPESIAKGLATKKRNNFPHNTLMRVSCLICKQETNVTSFGRWHRH